ncbi:uncharacterized protein LOC131988655 [Centropristis striata]|uniref:uncharacterized protein LOC131988655 n=1 Tax=Centropristis striata TaxID=184440 RepID=UPI0027E15469|nr:uncharacterized protein LOC131988655 [Centropristis striata]XP_059209818.1 uncharacterized protein LOC131988655 [Centropristis striata]XP_059209819.1 uncharacterized protein LOC131988655 [Centropristis striata]
MLVMKLPVEKKKEKEEEEVHPSETPPPEEFGIVVEFLRKRKRRGKSAKESLILMELESSGSTSGEDSGECSDSGVSLSSDNSKGLPISFRRSFPRLDISPSEEKQDVADDLVECSDDQAGQRNVEQEVSVHLKRISDSFVGDWLKSNQKNFKESQSSLMKMKGSEESSDSGGSTRIGSLRSFKQWKESVFSQAARERREKRAMD